MSIVNGSNRHTGRDTKKQIRERKSWRIEAVSSTNTSTDEGKGDTAALAVDMGVDDSLLMSVEENNTTLLFIERY